MRSRWNSSHISGELKMAVQAGLLKTCGKAVEPASRTASTQWFILTTTFALRMAQRQMPDHASPFSPKRFTQPQLLACLILKPQLGGSYRSIVQRLTSDTALRDALGFSVVPHYSTFQRFADRLGDPQLLARLRRRACRLTIRAGQWWRRTNRSSRWRC